MIPVLNHEALQGLDLRVLSIQRTAAGRWWNFRQVISPFSRLWLGVQGRAVVRHHGRRFVLRPGQLHLVPPFTVHDCACADRFDHYHLHFVARLPTGIDLLSLLDCEHQLTALPGTRELFERLERIYPGRKLPCFDPSREEYKRPPEPEGAGRPQTGAVEEFEARAALGLLLSPILKTAVHHEGTHARVTRQFLAVQEYIHAHMRERVRLADLAAVVRLNPTYFSDQFHRVVGVRPLDYLTRRRIERSQDLLLTTQDPVKQIADAVGFPDAAYFSRVFTRLCRVSPTAYRAAHARGEPL